MRSMPDHPGLPVPGEGNHGVSRDLLNGATGQLAELLTAGSAPHRRMRIRSTGRRPPAPVRDRADSRKCVSPIAGTS